MLGLFKQQSRLCVLESQFKQFQVSISDYMKKNDSSTNEIIKHIDAKHKISSEALDSAKKDIITMLEKDYSTKLDSEKNMTAMRISIMADLKRTLITYIALISAVLALCGWLYVNVGQHNNYNHEITKGGYDAIQH